MNIEPIHEIHADELQDVLDKARDDIECELKSYSDSVLKTLADSIKKSLIFLFPKFDEEIRDIIDANEASYAMSWATIYPFGEGVTALRKIYGVLHDYQEPNDFKEMEAAIKDYARIAQHYFHDHKMKEAEPLVKEGMKRQKQLHAPKQKKNKALMKYCRELMLKKPSSSAKRLWGRLPEKGKSIIIDGTEIYRYIPGKGEAGDGDEKIFCIAPNGKKRLIGERAFAKYFNEIKKSLNDNS